VGIGASSWPSGVGVGIGAPSWPGQGTNPHSISLPQLLSKSRMLYLHGKYTEQLTNLDTSTLKMKAACTSEMSATMRRTARCNNPRTRININN
jgi:hypothetical protein